MASSPSPVKYAIINAFTDSAPGGNPAAVCVMADEEEREETWMQFAANQINAPATCFLIPILDPHTHSFCIPKFKIRWFTPATQIKLCGHATLAASHYCFTSGLVKGNQIEYSTISGSTITAKQTTSKFPIELDFPLIPLVNYNSTPISSISEALSGAAVVDIKRTATEEDLIVVLESVAAVVDLQPDFEKIRRCPGRGIIVTSLAQPRSQFDFISRFFFPKIGVNEDAVCGSAHSALANYWSKKLGKTDFLAYAASARGGVVKLHLNESNTRVRLQGKAITVTEDSLLG